MAGHRDSASNTSPVVQTEPRWHARREARDHSVVSAELRAAIKDSIEIIGNDVLDRHRAQGLSIAELQGAELGNQALRYLYRILFLLFAEASPELHILPTGDNDYDEGYGLSRLRDQILAEPATIQAQNGTHLYESLQLLFDLVNKGHDHWILTSRSGMRMRSKKVCSSGLSTRTSSVVPRSPTSTR